MNDAVKPGGMIPLAEEPVQRPKTVRPGILLGDLTLELQTQEAFGLLTGFVSTQSGKAKIGLTSFIRAAREKVRGKQIERMNDSLDRCLFCISQIQQQVERHQDQSPIKINQFKSRAPIKREFKGLSTSAIKAAQILVEYDAVMLGLHQLYALGIYNKEQYRKLTKEAKKHVIEAFLSPLLTHSNVMEFVTQDDLDALNIMIQKPHATLNAKKPDGQKALHPQGSENDQ